MAISDQIDDAAEYFALALKNTEPGISVEIPEWLSLKAQSWIENNAKDFSELVVRAYEHLRDDATRAKRPTFVLPTPGEGKRKHAALP